MKRTYTINPTDAPEELVSKVKRLVQKDNLGEYLELKFNTRFDSCRVRDINNGQLVAVYDLNYKEDNEDDSPVKPDDKPTDTEPVSKTITPTVTKKSNATAIRTVPKTPNAGTAKKRRDADLHDQGKKS